MEKLNKEAKRFTPGQAVHEFCRQCVRRQTVPSKRGPELYRRQSVHGSLHIFSLPHGDPQSSGEDHQGLLPPMLQRGSPVCVRVSGFHLSLSPLSFWRQSGEEGIGGSRWI